MKKNNTQGFSKEEWLRYTRHIQLSKIGVAGQQALKKARVLVVGAGGLGSPVSMYLAAAGVGDITLVDHDTIDVTNLQRQILFRTEQVGESKSDRGKINLEKLNPHINITAVKQAFSEDNADTLVSEADLVLDCTDNFLTRYLINDACVKNGKPWIYAGIYQFSGQCALFLPGKACYRCIFPEPSNESLDCNAAGVLGVLPGLLGTLQASEAIKYICGLKTPLANTLMLVDALALDFRKIQLNKSPDCECNKQNPEFSVKDFAHCAVSEDTSFEVALGDELDSDRYKVVDVRSVEEHSAFNLGGDNIPLAEIENSIDELVQEKTIVFYCQSGARSRLACQILLNKGIDAISLQGGIVGHLKRAKKS